MTKSIRTLAIILVVSSALLSACGSIAAIQSPSAAKVEAAEVAFTGAIESMNGTQWVVNGQTITVDPLIAKDMSFKVGDTVKVEAMVAADGSVSATRVEVPGAPDLVISTLETPSGSAATTLLVGTAPAQGMGGQSGLVIDNSGSEAFGAVDAITVDTITIAGQMFALANGAEFNGQIAAGDYVKVHFTLKADGTMSVTQIEPWDPSLAGNDNSNSNLNTNDNSNDDNLNDDDGNTNDDGHSDNDGDDEDDD